MPAARPPAGSPASPPLVQRVGDHQHHAQLCLPCSAGAGWVLLSGEGIRERKGRLWCVSSVPRAVEEGSIEGAPPVGGLAGLTLGGGRGCQPPPWAWGSLCTWGCGVGTAVEVGTASGCLCRVVLTVPMLSPWAMCMFPGLSLEGTEIRDTGTPGCSRHCLGCKVSGLERELFVGLDGNAESQGGAQDRTVR